MFSEFFSRSDFLHLPLVAFAIFLFAFSAVLAWVFFGLRRGPKLDHIASLPLEDDAGEEHVVERNTAR